MNQTNIIIDTTRMLMVLDNKDFSEFKDQLAPEMIFSGNSPCGIGKSIIVSLGHVPESEKQEKLDFLDNFMRKHKISYVAFVGDNNTLSYFANEHDQFQLTPIHIF